ncbi:hypothetical protein BDF19DRAFT_420916 [Syncephalis fuscata]|nr:hypothetical protein BDF19DRAFT_420916 [Syncephalis fuscata]
MQLHLVGALLALLSVASAAVVQNPLADQTNNVQLDSNAATAAGQTPVNNAQANTTPKSQASANNAASSSNNSTTTTGQTAATTAGQTVTKAAGRTAGRTAATTAGQTAATSNGGASAPQMPSIGNDYIYNPNPGGMKQYKFLQPPFEENGGQRCAAIMPKVNQDETVRMPYQETCGYGAQFQYINYWEVKPKSNIYMIRFSNSMTCLAILSVNTNNGPTPTPAIVPCARDPSQLFKLNSTKDSSSNTTSYQIMPYSIDACLTAQTELLTPLLVATCDPQYAGIQNWYMEDVQDTINGFISTMTIQQYADQFKIANITARLGLNRQSNVGKLITNEISRVNSTVPGALKPLTTVFDLARFVKLNVQNAWKNYKAGTPLVDHLVNMIFTADQLKGFMGHPIRILNSIVSALPLPPIVTKGLKQKAADYSKQPEPTASDLLEWNMYALGYSDIIADDMYAAYIDMFNTATIEQLYGVLADFTAGKYDISADKRCLLDAVCASANEDMCKGNWGDKRFEKRSDLYNGSYMTNLPSAAINYLEDQLQERGNFYEGKNNWKLTRYLYTCPNGQCRAKLALRGGFDGTKFELFT